MGGWPEQYALKINWVAPLARPFGRTVGVAPRFSRYTDDALVRFDLDIEATGYGRSVRSGAIADTPLKYEVPSVPMPPMFHVNVEYGIRDLLLEYGFPSQVDVPCFEEMIQRGDVELDTTPGYPHVTRFRTKREFFSDPAVSTHLKAEIQNGGWNRDYLWNSFAKKEVLRDGKAIRQICGCEAPLLYHLGPLVHDFNKRIELAGALGFPLYLGTSFEGEDFKIFVDQFSSCKYVLSLDATSWDTSVPAFALESVARLRASFLPFDAAQKLLRLYDSLVDKLIVDMDGEIIEVTGGMPSGQPSTAHDNSIINLAYLMCFLQEHGLTLADVSVAIYGDDLLLGFKSLPPFEPPRLKHWYAEYGFLLKCSDTWQSFLECDFLSRRPISLAPGLYSFVFDRHRKMLESMRYVSPSMHALDALIKLVQLRNMLAGTSSFKRADFLARKEIDRMGKIAHYAKQTRYKAALRMLVDERYELRRRAGFVMVQQGNFKDIAHGFIMESKHSVKNNKKGNKQKQNKGPKVTVKVNPKGKSRSRSATVKVITASKPKHKAPSRRPQARGGMAAFEAKERAGATAISRVSTRPMDTPPIRFPNLGALKLGTVPFIDVGKFPLPKTTSAAFPNKGYGIIAGTLGYGDPVWLGQLDASGNIAWSSIGRPFSFPYMVTNGNANLLRVNAFGMRATNITPEMYRSLNIYYLNVMSYKQDAGAAPVFYLPGTLLSILNNPLTKLHSGVNIPKYLELVPQPAQLEQTEFAYPQLLITDAQYRSDAVIAVIEYPVSIAGTGIDGANIVMQYRIQAEYVPSYATQPYTDTKATNVSMDTLQTVNAMQTSSVPPDKQEAGLWDRVKSVGGEMWDVGKKAVSVASDVWDFASPFVSDIAAFLGFLSPHKRSAVLHAFGEYYDFVQFLHMQCGLHAVHYVSLKGMFWHKAVARSPSELYGTRVRDYPEQKEYRELFLWCLRSIRHRLHPLAIAYLSKVHECSIETVYGFDTSSVTAPWVIDGGYLRWKDIPAAKVTVVGPQATITLICMGWHVTGNAVPTLMGYVAGQTLEFPLDIIGSSLDELKLPAIDLPLDPVSEMGFRRELYVNRPAKLIKVQEIEDVESKEHDEFAVVSSPAKPGPSSSSTRSASVPRASGH